jgi:hypothetical protein
MTLTFSESSAAQEIVITVNPDDNKPGNSNPPFAGTRPAADMAILLDTSNSMDGLINQAKSQLWGIVQQFAKAQKSGQTPVLRVAVFEYGNTNLPASEGYIRQVVGLTDDLDKISEALFSLTTQGGDEYCGQVINEALSRLDWCGEPNAFKAIFIAGNEPFTQGQVDYRKSCKRAIESGVIVNTIHCGNQQKGINGKWQHGAQLAEGEYLNIDQDRAVIAIKTPHDKILIELNEQLNRTYMWYGKKNVRMRYSKNQVTQDKNALQQLGAGGLSSRAAVKGGRLYSNVGRDLVDSFKSNEKVLEEVDEEELPDALQKLPADQRAAAIKDMTAKRSEIQKKIEEVTKQRMKYIADEKSKMAESGKEATLGDAVNAAVTKQMEASGFKFK